MRFHIRTRPGWLAFLLLLAAPGAAQEPHQDDPLDRCNVVWTSPSRDSSGSMPLGNGDVGVNAWIEENGDLLFYVSKTDAWNENGRLLKLGRLRVRLTPNPFAKGAAFRQALRLRQGEMEVRAGKPGAAVVARLWVDANRPVVRMEMEGERPFTAEARLEVWRTGRREMKGKELFSAFGEEGAPYPIVEYPDTVLPPRGVRLAWFHRNPVSLWRRTLEHQGMAEWARRAADPILHRTFGGAVVGTGMRAVSGTMLKTTAPVRRCTVSVYALTLPGATPAQWSRRLDRIVAEANRTPIEQAREQHRRWWAAFWDRSWIRVTGPSEAAPLTTNDLPLRIGADSDGQNRFRGHVARVRVWPRALATYQIAALTKIHESSLLGMKPVADWILDGAPGGVVRDWAGADHPARVIGTLAFETADGFPAARFDGRGYLEVAAAPRLDLTGAVTLEAWVRPEALPEGGARILDKSRAGTDNGYLLDTWPGNSLRMITQPGTLRHDARLPAGKWVHVAATYDAATGTQRLYVDGRVVAEERRGGSTEDITRGYALQRYMIACAGRGNSPIKFNGSLFTVDSREPGEIFDADYRRWGGPYWFQNTRLAYWPMLAAGDFEMLRPLFRMYHSALPFAVARTRTYFGHEGAYFPETMHFWGAWANENYGWDRAGKPVSQVDNTYIRWYYSGTLELLALGLELYGHTQDGPFLRETLLPLADAVLDFYDAHYPRENGRLVFRPAQALETWQDVVNPMPEIAGLRHVLDGLTVLPDINMDRRARWTRLRAELPPVPLKPSDAGPVLAPAETLLQGTSNSENPELYAVFPYRLYGVERPDLETAQRAFAARLFKGREGWRQDEIHAACLGLAREAARDLAARFASKHPGSRFPAFWGPNYDWVPDQDHGSSGMMALQTMLLQADGRRLLLFPAWPKAWDVEFRLRAQGRTTLEGVYRGGKLRSLKVTPERRRKDVTILPAQE